ncbi:hypothetical protein F5882DRAFT_413056 [Hyaloscypha sp. PMI_1271]|nr:hypothetical protein F5882DRAFT_413056 [Hyaloscypha sp. PMI_1271]
MGYDGLPKETGDSELMPAPEFNRSGRRIASGTCHRPPATLSFCEDEERSTLGYNGLPKETGDSELMPAPENRGAETSAEGVGKDPWIPSSQGSLGGGADSLRRNSFKIKTGSQRMDPRNHWIVRSVRQKKLAISELERQRITKYIALEDLIYAQTADGRFDLNNDLGTAVKNQFKHWRFDLLVSELGESMVYKDMDKVLETARTIVLIEVKHADAQDSWKLVIQKARAFVSTVIRDEGQREKLFGVLQNQLSGLQAPKTSHWLLRGREKIDGILQSHILDDPKELLNFLRASYGYFYYRRFDYKMEMFVEFLGSNILLDVYKKERKEKSRPSNSGIDHENPDEWTDGWDDILNLLEAINSVMRERRELKS